MQKVIKAAVAAAVSSLLAACGGHSGTLPVQAGSSTGAFRATHAAAIADQQGWVPKFAVIKPGINYTQLPAQIADGLTIPVFTGSIVSPLDNNTYTYTIAGSDPHQAKVTTNLTYVPIVVIMNFGNGVTLDPTQPGCNDNVSVQDRFFNGPNFEKTSMGSNGITVGDVQINDADQRAQWWKLVRNSGWHTELVKAHSPIVITRNAPSGSQVTAGVCSGANHDLGEVPLNAFNGVVQALAKQYSSTTQIPLILTYNVVFTQSGGCCVIGFHSAFSRNGGTQVYAVGAYNDAGIFSQPIEDISAWTHEIGELMNDPFVDNATPLWGNIGQVQGCQGNLEVGDPLTGTPFTKIFNHFTYHPQELAFFDWFFRTPSEGTGGKYSFKGTFTTTQPLCS